MRRREIEVVMIIKREKIGRRYDDEGKRKRKRYN